MSILGEERIRVAVELDVKAFQGLMAEEGRGVPDEATALAALHKVRCELARQGAIDKDLGAESGRWLVARDMFHGTRWWLL